MTSYTALMTSYTALMTSGYGRTKAAAFIIIDTNKT